MAEILFRHCRWYLEILMTNLNSLLWHTVTEDKVQYILAACNAIIRLPIRARCVRKLKYGVDLIASASLKEQLKGWTITSRQGSPVHPRLRWRALRALTNREELYISSDGYRSSGFCSVLCSLFLTATWPCARFTTPHAISANAITTGGYIPRIQAFLG